jgi:hypothetical protein
MKFVHALSMSNPMSSIMRQYCTNRNGYFVCCDTLMQRGNHFWNNFVKKLLNDMAEGQGLEPRFTGPEPVVLPLDDPSAKKTKPDQALMLCVINLFA